MKKNNEEKKKKKKKKKSTLLPKKQIKKYRAFFHKMLFSEGSVLGSAFW